MKSKSQKELFEIGLNNRILLSEILRRLKVAKGSDPKGNYTAWCPFHPDGQGKPPHQPNLSVSEKGFYCHACGEKGGLSILAKHLGISVSRGDPSATYDYLDENGKLIFQVVRYPDKSFLQRRPDGSSGWIWNLNGTRRVLYRLPDLLRNGQSLVFIVEGEKDVNRLYKLGLFATTNAGGAGKWRVEYSDYLKDRDVAIIPDNDEPGKKHAEQVANSLLGIANSVRIIELPGLKPKGDVSDWLADGHGIDELRELYNNAPLITSPLNSTVENDYINDIHLTDFGNAQRLIARHGKDLRYFHPWNKWLIWDGKCWQIDKTAEIERRAKDTIRQLFVEAAGEENADIRKSLSRHALSSESNYKLKAMVKLATSESGIPVIIDELDSDNWLLNCDNGTLDLGSGELQQHMREDLITRILPVKYDSSAKCHKWEEFLYQIMGGSEELVDFLQRAVGYSLSGDTSEQCLFVLYGNGSNGKTTFIETLMALLADYAVKTPAETLMLKRSDNISNDIARLKGARLVAACEAELGRRFGEALIKQLTGGDIITARFLHQEFFDFSPSCKIWFATNHKPMIKGTDHAIWRRIRLIPFNVTILDDDQDKDLPNKLLAELPGILSWAVYGCNKWQEKGLGLPEEVREATAQYRNEMDTLKGFIDDCCEVLPNAEAQASELYKAYCDWCDGYGEKKMTSTAFGRDLTERGFTKKKDTKGRRLTYYYGIGMREDE